MLSLRNGKKGLEERIRAMNQKYKASNNEIKRLKEEGLFDNSVMLSKTSLSQTENEIFEKLIHALNQDFQAATHILLREIYTLATSIHDFGRTGLASAVSSLLVWLLS
mmetsp:Transcript_25176/g.37291  ORF Transcript_25176/g.37291 Transcript_25176/m.37291 type:complete len:108 (-) Transcript_25176:201-524(-)